MGQKISRRNSRRKSGKKSGTTKAGKYVREEMHDLKRGKKGGRGPKSKKQAIAIGLSRARRAGVDVPRSRRSRKGRT